MDFWSLMKMSWCNYPIQHIDEDEDEDEDDDDDDDDDDGCKMLQVWSNVRAGRNMFKRVWFINNVTESVRKICHQ